MQCSQGHLWPSLDPIPPEGIDAACPQCRSVPGPPIPPPRPAGLAPPPLPNYEIVRELGRGGMGVVYLARQKKPPRAVALKLLAAPALLYSPQLRSRFRIEIEAVARVQHPGIVAIYEVGEQDGWPYFSMEFVEGPSLAQKLEGNVMAPAEAARLVATLAEALHAVHQQQIVHRDLKPENILVPATGPPKISDFGLAKLVDAAATELTASGVVMGTMGYMSPEQARGVRDLNHATDLYALGAILYRLLAGRPPLTAASWEEYLCAVRDQEPAPIKVVRPQVDRDLATICHQCLHKDPAQRYRTADALAHDLHCYLRGAPIVARPEGFVARGRRWCRQRPAIALLSGLLAAALVLGLAGIGWQWHDAVLERRRADAAASENARRRIDVLVARGVALLESGDIPAALPWLAEAARLDPDADRLRVHSARLDAALRQCPQLVQLWTHDAPVLQAVYSLDGRRLVTVDATGVMLVRDAEAERDLHRCTDVRHAALSPDGKQVLAVSVDGQRVRRIDIASGEVLALTNAGLPDPLPTPNGPQRISTLHFAVLKRATAPPAFYFGGAALVHMAVYSPDGAKLAIVDVGGVHIFPADGGKLLTHVEGSKGATWAAFDRAGKQLLTGGDDDAVHVWSVADGQLVQTPQLAARRAAFSPDGAMLVVTPGDRTAALWDLSKKQLAFPSLGHAGLVHSVAFSPDGGRALTTTSNGTAWLWDVKTGQLIGPALAHGDAVLQGGFHPDGCRILTASYDGGARVWNPAPVDPREVSYGPSPGSTTARLSPDGRWLAALGPDHATVWPIGSNQPAWRSPAPGSGWNVAWNLSRDGRRLLLGQQAVPLIDFPSTDFTITTWDLADRAAKPVRWEMAGQLHHASFSNDGRQVVLAGATEDGKEGITWIRPLAGAGAGVAIAQPSPVLRAEFDPEGRRLVTAAKAYSVKIKDDATDELRMVAKDHAVTVWDAATGAPLSRPLAHQGTLRDVRFNADGSRVVTAADDQRARIWDWKTNRIVLLPHRGSVRRAAFAPDGVQVVTASADGTVGVWDASAGTMVLPPLQHADEVESFAFSEDGRWLLTAAADRTLAVWDRASGTRAAPRMSCAAPIVDAALLPGKVVALCKDGRVRTWTFAPDAVDDVARLLRRAALASSHRLELVGRPVALSARELQDAWDELRRRRPD